MNSTSMRLWAGLFVLVVFVAGVAGGVALRPWVESDPQPEFGRRGLRRGGPPGPVAGRLFDRISADIGLTADQNQQLRAVFETRGQRMREIDQEVRDLFETEQAQMNAEIAEILTPEQMELFEREIVLMRGRPRSPPRRGGPRSREFRRDPRRD
jgi:Spy/CpxP family protein refolding chaperone